MLIEISILVQNHPYILLETSFLKTKSLQLLGFETRRQPEI